MPCPSSQAALYAGSHWAPEVAEKATSNEAVAGAGLEAYARRLHHRYACVEMKSAQVGRLSAQRVVVGVTDNCLIRAPPSLQSQAASSVTAVKLFAL